MGSTIFGSMRNIKGVKNFQRNTSSAWFIQIIVMAIFDTAYIRANQTLIR